ncbi:cytochrome P450 [Sinomonas cellulolyticus]|uniref:Cytochrome P450 n=1 Tax=Sinomonas cellulolyticus TaxID=2801916 RepID=A0ABS1K5H0_9MICC|nr:MULTISPECIES: cytochrome P450 [Sinomonas]MBL0706137.1 cytochrome P450 [Sinomonas cellulolyticus]GHG55143.1 cytochrome P450 [Sinomonas sp. KCTC 49339]
MSPETQGTGCPFGFGTQAGADTGTAPAGAGHAPSAANATTHNATHHGYEPFQMKNPFPAYAALRAEEPVMWDERIGMFVVTRYDDIKAVFDDWETFSSENAQAPVRKRGPQATQIMNEGGFTAYSGLSARIPPEHTRIRGIVQKAFTPRRFKVLEPFIRQNVADRLDAMIAKGTDHGEIVKDLAYEVPTITILTLIGEDISRIDDYKRWSDSRAAMTWGDMTDEEQIPHAHNLVEYWQACLALVAKAHAEGGDNLVADLVQAQKDGAEISDHEIASVCYSLLFAGHETTTTLISNAVRLLAADATIWAQLVEDPKKIPGAIDEVLRYSGSIVAWRRKATKDAEIAGVKIPEGSGVLLVMGSANRDESKFEDPELFDIARPNAREHLSFGFGIHYCLGNMLAKLQAKIALEEMTAKLPHLTVDDPESIEFRENLSFRVPIAVPVSWTE